MSDTVEIGGTEFDAEDVERAIDLITDECDDTDDRIVVVNNVVLEGDGFADGDTYVYDRRECGAISDVVEGDYIDYENIDVLRESFATPFKTFVEEEFAVMEVEGEAYMDGYDLEVTTGQDRPTFGTTTMQDLDESDDVGIRYVTWGDGYGDPVTGDEPCLRISLVDERDDE